MEPVQIAYDKFTIHFESNPNNIDSLVYLKKWKRIPYTSYLLGILLNNALMFNYQFVLWVKKIQNYYIKNILAHIPSKIQCYQEKSK